MGRTIYATTLTFVWLILLGLLPHPTLSPALLIPVIVVLGAWLAASGVRVGYVAFSVLSFLMTFALGLLSMASLVIGGFYFVGGDLDNLRILLTYAAILMISAIVHFIGLGVLRPRSAATT